MLLIVLEVLLLALAVLFLLSGASERNGFNRASNYTVGAGLLILLTAILYLWR